MLSLGICPDFFFLLEMKIKFAKLEVVLEYDAIYKTWLIWISHHLKASVMPEGMAAKNLVPVFIQNPWLWWVHDMYLDTVYEVRDMILGNINRYHAKEYTVCINKTNVILSENMGKPVTSVSWFL